MKKQIEEKCKQYGLKIEQMEEFGKQIRQTEEMMTTITTGLAGANTADLAGFQPQYCQDFVTNLLLWTLKQIPPPVKSG